jgi:hypothetical protein
MPRLAAPHAVSHPLLAAVLLNNCSRCAPPLKLNPALALRVHLGVIVDHENLRHARNRNHHAQFVRDVRGFNAAGASASSANVRDWSPLVGLIPLLADFAQFFHVLLAHTVDLGFR